MSGAIEIVAYRDEWPGEFALVAVEMLDLLGGRALRIDHVGSTSVPGLGAKDIIDVQVTMAALDDDLESVFTGSGHSWHPYLSDRAPATVTVAARELAKRVAGARPGDRRANIHMRVKGAYNWRYALLFRDYLRSERFATQAYEDLKVGAAAVAGDDIDVYYSLKDPMFDMIAGAAERWASVVGWEPGPADA